MHPKNRYGNPKTLIDHIIKDSLTEKVEVIMVNPESPEKSIDLEPSASPMSKI